MERTVRVVDKLIPILLGDPGRKTVGIEGRRAGHGKDFSVGRVHGHDGPHLAREELLRSFLKVEIERQLQFSAYLSFHFVQETDLPSDAGYKHLPLSIRSREVLVVDSLDSRLADQIARCRARKGFSENFVLRHLPDVTQHVRSQASMAVVSSRLGSQLNLRMLPLVGFHD